MNHRVTEDATRLAHDYMCSRDLAGNTYTVREVSAVSGLPIASASFVLNWHRRRFEKTAA